MSTNDLALLCGVLAFTIGWGTFWFLMGCRSCQK